MSVEQLGRGIGRWLAITHILPPAIRRGVSSSPTHKTTLYRFDSSSVTEYHVRVSCVPV